MLGTSLFGVVFVKGFGGLLFVDVAVCMFLVFGMIFWISALKIGSREKASKLSYVSCFSVLLCITFGGRNDVWESFDFSGEISAKDLLGGEIQDFV